MDKSSIVQKYVNAALLRLRIEKIIYTMQSGMFLAIVGAVFSICTFEAICYSLL